MGSYLLTQEEETIYKRNFYLVLQFLPAKLHSARERSPIAKNKNWLSIHPRNFGSYVTVRPSVHLLVHPSTRPSAPQEHQCEISHSLHCVHVGASNLILNIDVVVN